MKKLFTFFISGFLFCSTLQSQNIDSSKLEEIIDSMIPKHVSDSTPGLVVGILHKDELIFSKGYGMANLAYGIPNDPGLVYNIGSVSKQFLGYAFAMLHVEGKLDINDPVTKYLEDWPEFEHEVKLIHLLTHTSGYREAYTMSNLAGREIGVDRLSREECLNVVRRQPHLEFVPGSRYTYNSTAWVILAEVFEKVAGESAEDWVKTNLLDPLRMENTQIETYIGEVIQNPAESYSLTDQGYRNERSNRAIFGAAEVYTSIEDLAKWMNNYKTAAIGGEEVRNLFLDPYIFSDGINSGYALGIFNNEHKGLKMYSHTGGHEAFVTQARYYPEADLGIMIISNYGWRGNIFAGAIAEEILGDSMTYPEKPEPARVSKKKLESFTGQYIHSSWNRKLNVSMVNDSLTINEKTRLMPVDKSTFSIVGRKSEIQIMEASNGATQLVITEPNSRDTYVRMDTWNVTDEALTRLEGAYWSDELETTYFLKMNNGQLFIHHRWLAPIALSPVAENFFETAYGFYVRFQRNERGSISGFSIYSGRTLDVFFEKKE